MATNLACEMWPQLISIRRKYLLLEKKKINEKKPHNFSSNSPIDKALIEQKQLAIARHKCIGCCLLSSEVLKFTREKKIISNSVFFIQSKSYDILTYSN